MKYFKKKYLIFPLMSALLVACGDTVEEQSPAEMQQEATEAVEDVDGGEVEDIAIDVTVSVDGDEVSDLNQTLEVKPDTVLLDAMDEVYDLEADDGFVTKIDDFEQDPDNNKYWLYYINGESATVGANEYQLQEDDQIEWRLEALD